MPEDAQRLPPSSPDAERALLGCMLLSPQEVIAAALDEVKPGSKAFFDLRHRALYETLLLMYDNRVPIDLVSVRQTLLDTDQLENVGGFPYLVELPDATPCAANFHYYIEVLLHKWTLRQMIMACATLIEQAHHHHGTTQEIVDRAEAIIHSVSDSTQYSSLTATAAELIDLTVEKIEKLAAAGGQMTGITTGFQDFDRLTWGMHPGEMTVLAARPSHGKSAFAMNVAAHVAGVLGLAVGIFSLEMSCESLMMRMISAHARVSNQQIREAKLSEHQWYNLALSAQAIRKFPMFIDDSAGLSIIQLRAKARRMQQKHGIKLFIVDYLQLLHSPSRNQNRQEEVADISRGLRTLAKELKVPVLVLAQLNRKVEERGPTAKPRLSELRESGGIEQDADVVALLYKAKEEEDNTSVAQMALSIAKSRNGPLGEVALVFLKGCTRFESSNKAEAPSVSYPYPD